MLLSDKEYYIIKLMLEKGMEKQRVTGFLKTMNNLEQKSERKFNSPTLNDFASNYVKLRDNGVLHIDISSDTMTISNNSSDWSIPNASDYNIKPPSEWQPMSEQERWAIGDKWIKEGRRAMSPEEAQKKMHKREDYPFFIYPYKKVVDTTNEDKFDLKLLIRLLEFGCVGYDEVINLFDDDELRDIIYITRTDAWDYVVPRYYSAYNNMLLDRTLEAAAKEIAPRYLNRLNNMDNRGTREEELQCFVLYLLGGAYDQRWIKPKKEKELDDMLNYADRFSGTDGNKIIYVSDDETGVEELSVTYDNPDDMKNDILYLINEPYFAKHMFGEIGRMKSLECKKVLNIFGKQYTLRDIIEEYYNRYPNGIDGETFFHTFREAYNANYLAFESGNWQFPRKRRIEFSQQGICKNYVVCPFPTVFNTRQSI